MAIYHLRHSSIGRSTHKPGDAARHINYITRESAATEIMAEHIPENRHKAKRWVTEQELSDVKNARVIDKVEVGLPLELTHEQNCQLVIDYCRTVTKGRTPWLAVIHDQPQDAHNPHAHIVFRDRDIETGLRVMMTTERKSTVMFRTQWEHICNTHLALHGHDERIDRRTLEAQGIDRIPQIHVGPEANAAIRRGAEIQSIIREDKKKIGQKLPRKINYPGIDKGMTRLAFNEHIIDLNLERMRRSRDYGTRLKADFEAEQRKKDRALLNRRDDIRRYAKAASGEIWDEYQSMRDHIIKTNRQEKHKLTEDLKKDYKPLWNAHFERRKQAFAEAEKKHKETQERLDQLKRSLPHLWSQLEPTQDKARGKLSAVFQSSVAKEDRLKALGDHYKSEHQKLYKQYSDEKRVLSKIITNEQDDDLTNLKKSWDVKKTAVKSETDLLWKDYSRELRARQHEKKFERENLQNYIEEYQNEFVTTPPDKKVPAGLQERIEKAKGQTKHHGDPGGGPDKQPAQNNYKSDLEDRIHRAASTKSDKNKDHEP